MILVSPEDKDLLTAHTWYVDTSTGYAKSRCGKSTQYLHRVILERVIGHKPKYTDHINRKKLDNRRENLREVTNSENMLNINPTKANTSGTVGVSRFRDKWRAYITLAGKQIHLGYYKTKKLARIARLQYQGR